MSWAGQHCKVGGGLACYECHDASVFTHSTGTDDPFAGPPRLNSAHAAQLTINVTDAPLRQSQPHHEKRPVQGQKYGLPSILQK